MTFPSVRLRNFYRCAIASVGLLAISVLEFAPVGAAAAAPTPTAACQKVFTEVRNADKVYIALQFGVIKAASDYVAGNSLSNKLLYNDSFIKAIEAANRELNFAISSPKCYPMRNISGYKTNVKHNLTQIASIHVANVNGQIVGDPQKLLVYKPVGLLK